MGGMFDPVHLGHLEAARQLRDLLQLDSVRLIPCGTPVHRDPARASAAQRCAMLELAAAEFSWLRVDRREVDSPAPSWTYDSLSALRTELPDAGLYLIVGMDAFLSLPTWRRWSELTTLAHLIVCTRPGFDLNARTLDPALAELCRQRRVEEVDALWERPAGHLYLAQLATPDLSSTAVRARVAAGQPLDDVLPAAVADYLTQQHLYRAL